MTDESPACRRAESHQLGMTDEKLDRSLVRAQNGHDEAGVDTFERVLGGVWSQRCTPSTANAVS